MLFKIDKYKTEVKAEAKAKTQTITLTKTNPYLVSAGECIICDKFTQISSDTSNS